MLRKLLLYGFEENFYPLIRVSDRLDSSATLELVYREESVTAELVACEVDLCSVGSDVPVVIKVGTLEK